jgi:hydrogenase large subunit
MAKTVFMPMNRVEGDLEVKVAIDDGVVIDAWMIGTMYRGIETMLIGRNSLDSLVITPRVCGICSTSHLLAAAMALEDLTETPVSRNGLHVRRIALEAETLQNDLRHLFLMFAADFIATGYADHPLAAEIERRYRPYQGSTVVATILATKKLPEIIAILGGQWPHSSFIVPGGITSQPSAADLRQCRLLLAEFRCWYEQDVLGCPCDRIAAIENRAQLEAWLEERPEHRDSELGFFLRCALAFGLDRLGRWRGTFLSGPQGGGETARGGQAGGVLHNGVLEGLDPSRIRESVACSHYQSDSGGHPAETDTHPRKSAANGRYSWCKAPRYNGRPAETGALAEALIGRDSLFTELVASGGVSALVRELARLLRVGQRIRIMEQELLAIDPTEPYYQPAGVPANGAGCGLIQAPRGVLGHWVQLSGGTIEHYQIIPPTTWNASPRDDRGVRGPIEEALVGTPVRDPADPVEVAHVVRSFDLCMVCSVHAMTRKGYSLGRVRIGS